MDKPNITVVPFNKEAEDSEYTPAKVLTRAAEENLEHVIILGVKDGEDGRSMHITCSEHIDPQEINWLLDLAKNVNMAEYI